MARAKRKVGQVTIRFYEYPDGSLTAKVFAGKNDIPDKKKIPYDFSRMLVLTGEIARYTQQQVNAMNILLVSRAEFKTIEEEINRRKVASNSTVPYTGPGRDLGLCPKCAMEKCECPDVDRLQTNLPFEEKDNG